MIPFRRPIVALAPEGDGGESAARQAPEVAGFPLDYVRELRAEKKSWQQKAAEMEAAASQAREQLAQAREAATARIVRAELRARATRAGMVDQDGVALLDLSGVRLNEAGEVEGADAAIQTARLARPWLFLDARTSNPERPPRPRESRAASDARQMTEKEYDAARKSRAWRR